MSRSFTPALLLFLLLPAGLRGQATLKAEDYGRWERLGGATLSPDGAWVGVAIGRVDGEDELRVRRVAAPDSVVTVRYGSRPMFSGDGRWLAYAIGVSDEARERAQKARRPVRDKLGILDLGVGTADTIDAVASFAFSPEGRFLAMRRYPPQGEREARGVDLVVRDMGGGSDTNFGNVAEFAWQDDAPRLALAIDAEGEAGNGVQVWDAATGRIATLDSRQARYTGLAWREDAADLAVLRSVPPGDEGEKAWQDTAQVVLAFTGLDRGLDRALRRELIASTPGVPAEHRIVPFQPLRWNDDGSDLLFGVQARVPAQDGHCPEPESADADAGRPEAGADSTVAGGDGGRDAPDGCEEDDEPTVEIWHAGDVDIIPTQKVRAERDRRENDLAVWHLAEGRAVRLEDETVEDVQVVEGAATAVGLDETPYATEAMFGPVRRDVWLVDLASGERRRVLQGVEHFFGMSPGGRWLLWLEDDQYRTYDVSSGRTAVITEGLPTSFVDREDDHTVAQKPPYGTGGWLDDDEAVILYDEHDLWRVEPDGSGGERLTRGAESNVRHRRERLDPEERAIDADEPQYFSLYDDWTEAWGYGRADELGDDVERLLWEEARVSGLTRAEDAEVYAYRVEDFDDSPDLFVGGPELRGATQVTRTNPFMGEYLWGRAELVTFVNDWGDTLQGSLYYPAGWEAGRRYPMITYIYEIRSNAVRSFLVPSERTYYDMQTWVQDGYFVFQPDIVYRDRDPGLSAAANIVPAVETVVSTGMIDSDRIGLIGHSWGGYQTAFVATQTDLFAAAVAGAPLTNLFSMYLSVYWNSGGTDARIFEISQGRMEVPFWEDEEAYRRNSPVFHVESLNTPLLMMQGTDDGAVDFNQGVEYYNAARRAGKEFVFLVYNDENHGLAKEANQKDYHRRINEWFAHWLKGKPGAEWITEGVPFLEQPGGRTRSGGSGSR